MANFVRTVRYHIPLPSEIPPGVRLHIPPPRRSAHAAAPTIPRAGTPTRRTVELEITDTAQGYVTPVLYGRNRFSPKLVHFDIVGTQIETQMIVSEGPIDGFEKVTLDDVEVYPTAAAGVDCQVRTGTLDQAAVTNITNATVKDMTHPGFAYISLRINILQAKLGGGIPHGEITARGRVCWDFRRFEPPLDAFSENPVIHVADAMTNPHYGAGLAQALIDASFAGSPTFNASADACDEILDLVAAGSFGQEESDTQITLGSEDKLQSFKAPAPTFKVSMKVRAVTTDPISFPAEVRKTPDGAALAMTYTEGGCTPTVGEDYVLSAVFVAENGVARGDTLYLVVPTGAWHASAMAWHLNTHADDYADGKAQHKTGGVWADVSFDHWIRVSVAERAFRSSLVVSERQPLEAVAAAILETCNGRLGVWDEKFRLTLDGEAADTGLLISDDPADEPDLPIVEDTLNVERSERDTPNVAVGTCLDTSTFQRTEVRFEADDLRAGLEQPKELRFDAVAVPSAGQLYRLLQTFLKRARRLWSATCSIPEHGLTCAPGDLLTLKSRLFSTSRTVLLDGIADNPDGTVELRLIEFDAADFVTAAYLAPDIPATSSTLLGDVVAFLDDFRSGGTTTGTIGELAWSLSGTGGSVSYRTEVAHPGIVRLAGGSGASPTLALDAANQKFVPNSPWATRLLALGVGYGAANMTITLSNGIYSVGLKANHSPATLWSVMIDNVDSGLDVDVSTWIDFRSWCNGDGTAHFEARFGSNVLTGSKAVSGTSATAYVYAGLGFGTVDLDVAELRVGSTRQS